MMTPPRWSECQRTYCQTYKACANEANCSSNQGVTYREAVPSEITPHVRLSDGYSLARAFHDAYERLAPQYEYETRADTKHFDPTTPNGKLMVAVCAEMLSLIRQTDMLDKQPGDSHPIAPPAMGAETLFSVSEAELADTPRFAECTSLDNGGNPNVTYARVCTLARTLECELSAANERLNAKVPEVEEQVQKRWLTKEFFEWVPAKLCREYAASNRYLLGRIEEEQSITEAAESARDEAVAKERAMWLKVCRTGCINHPDMKAAIRGPEQLVDVGPVAGDYRSHKP